MIWYESLVDLGELIGLSHLLSLSLDYHFLPLLIALHLRLLPILLIFILKRLRHPPLLLVLLPQEYALFDVFLVLGVQGKCPLQRVLLSNVHDPVENISLRVYQPKV